VTPGRRPVVWVAARLGAAAIAIATLAGGSGVDAHRGIALQDRPGTLAADAARPAVLAYYYIWFEERSWDRAKIDLPTLGRYASGDPAVVAQHVAWARAAGIDALIVSWKHEPRLDGPLATLVEAARGEGLRLVLLYQGLDFARQPLDVEKVANDMTWFLDTYGRDQVFDVFGAPAIVFSGSPSFSSAALARVRAAVDAAGPALLLGSERDAESYTARRDLLDGDAYYWSSVDPSRDRNHAARLLALGDAIRADDGLWLAPVAPGFDARLIGGSRVVDRADGAVYSAEWATALASEPDALAVISWNEFSENSHIEPSDTYGSRYLELTAELVRETLGRPAATDPASARPDAAIPSGTEAPFVSEPGDGGIAGRLVGPAVAAMVLAPVLLLALRARRPRPGDGGAPRR
jgi:hypothetical protein